MFNKNLEAIDNPALKRRLSRISEIESKSDMSYCISSSNDYVLLKNNLPIDDLKNPRQAIQKMFENTIKNTMINSILISIQHLPKTIFMVLINLSPIILTLTLSNYWGQILFFYTVMGFASITYINSMFFNKIFEKYIV